MTKAFIISFDFEGKTHLALASVREKNDTGLCYSIHFYDDALMRILPQDCYQTYSDNTKAQNDRTHPLADQLRNCIKESVVAHLQCIGGKE